MHSVLSIQHDGWDLWITGDYQDRQGSARLEGLTVPVNQSLEQTHLELALCGFLAGDKGRQLLVVAYQSDVLTLEVRIYKHRRDALAPGQYPPLW